MSGVLNFAAKNLPGQTRSTDESLQVIFLERLNLRRTVRQIDPENPLPVTVPHGLFSLRIEFVPGLSKVAPCYQLVKACLLAQILATSGSGPVPTEW